MSWDETCERMEIALIDVYNRLYPDSCYRGLVSGLSRIERELVDLRNSPSGELVKSNVKLKADISTILERAIKMHCDGMITIAMPEHDFARLEELSATERYKDGD